MFLTKLTKVLVNRQGTRAKFLPYSWQYQRLYSVENDSMSCGHEDPKDRSVQIDVETSIRYVNSEGKLSEKLMVKVLFGPSIEEIRPVTSCLIPGKPVLFNRIATGSPCPICRDMYLVLHHRNIKLLQQFISPYSNEILPIKKTGLCQKQQRNLIVAVLRAHEYGTLTYNIPYIGYDYEYYKELSKKSLEEFKS